MSLRIIYEGVDIYPDVSVGRCWCDQRAWGGLDALTVDFGDARNLWDRWGPAPGDSIAVEDGAARTGRMLVSSVVPQSSRLTVTAYPAPREMRERRCKSWERVRLFQLVGEVARRHGLTYQTYGLENYEYAYVEQDNESDLAFLDRRLTYEGASLIVHDGALVCYSGLWAEGQAVAGGLSVAPGVDYEFRDDSARSYGACEVTDGTTTGAFDAGTGGRLLRRVVPERISSAAEAERWARGLLRAENREATRMVIRTDSMLRRYAAGSVLDLSASAAASWDGTAVVCRIRHDYFDSRAKVWLTRPLGY